ncbi:hypothetical protein Micbo1qcDRAFT_169475 [Microdochium bolleyi]|uniref:Uncharacterized protein n=1 Tax=Microdochium bolleyi TaxID=196109 RepID=A0A136IKB6_9PEZI|nr:hypothetical protein Micbo1qcDRAFT_169475 [Microdochium bolleyi]
MTAALIQHDPVIDSRLGVQRCIRRAARRRPELKSRHHCSARLRGDAARLVTQFRFAQRYYTTRLDHHSCKADEALGAVWCGPVRAAWVWLLGKIAHLDGRVSGSPESHTSSSPRPGEGYAGGTRRMPGD